MRHHWDNCITHFDTAVDSFLADYFSTADRHCLLVAGAGFDPRARLIPERLSDILGSRLIAFLIREERGEPAANLLTAADATEAELRRRISETTVARIPIFADDGAPVGGARIGEALSKLQLPASITDIVLDMSALSIGVGFPAALFLLELCEASSTVSFHIMVASNPELDDQIVGEPTDRATNVRGYSGRAGMPGDVPVARIWLPQVAHGGAEALGKIWAVNRDVYKVCPVVPFPARNPRRADDLIVEYGSQFRDEWGVDTRDVIYVSERNPLDSYRTISTLKSRYDSTVEGVYEPQLILSPMGSKVIAAGAMMAAIEHQLPVQYVEMLRYELVPAARNAEATDMIVHVWLHGSVYAGYGAI
jgi:hypothetical protein